MTDENEESGVIDSQESEVSTPETSESSTPAVDADAIRAELQAEFDRKAKGLETAAAVERKKRQEVEEKLNEPSPGEPIDLESVKNTVRSELAEERRQAEQRQVVQSFQSKRDEAVERLGDIDEAAKTVGDVLPEELQLELMGLDKSWDLIKYLHDNPDKLRAIATASPGKAGIELGRLEASLDVKPAASVTSAPDPISPLTGGSGGVDDIYELPQGQYEAELAKRNGGSVFPS